MNLLLGILSGCIIGLIIWNILLNKKCNFLDAQQEMRCRNIWARLSHLKKKR